MDLNDLYRKLLALYGGGKLTLSYYCVEGIFDGLLTVLNLGGLELAGGQPQKRNGEIGFSGSASFACFGAGGTLAFTVRVEDGKAAGEISLSFEGEYALRDFFPANTVLAESPFRNFRLRSPVFCTSFEEKAAGLAISCNTRPDFSDEAWDTYRSFFDERLMPTTGFYSRDGFGNAIVNLDFAVNGSFFDGMILGKAAFRFLSVILAIRMAPGDFDEEPKLYPLLLLNLQENDLFQQGLTLEVPVLGKAGYVQYAAYFTPVLSAGNVVNFIGRLTGASVAELLPGDTFLTSFGLKYIGVRTENDLSKLGDVKEMEIVFDLERPWQTPFSCLTLKNFQVGFTASWWDHESKNALVSADFLVQANLKLKSHTITGKLKGCLPQMSFEGALELYEDDALSLNALSEDLDAKLPGKWTGENPIASILVSANPKNRILYLNAQAEDVLSIDIGSTVFKLESISAYITLTPERTGFGIEGGASFGSGDANFLMLLNAEYEDGWSFGGSLGRGEVNVGKLLKQMFGIESGASEDILSIALTEFEFSYSVKDSSFYLYAVMKAGWKLPMGFLLETGGRLKLSQEGEKALTVSAAAYLEIGHFLCLVQADDLSGEKPKYLFRVRLGKVYAQAVYEQNQNKENILIISLGGVTLGEIVETLVRLINPNARTHLESPWDVLNRIDLSAFSLEINMDRKTAVFWVDIQKSLAGLIELDKIGLLYEDGHIKYQMTGRMLGQEYSTDKPASWDAQTGTPQTPSAQKTKLYYLGLGQHIDVDVSAATIREVLKSISKALKPGEPSLAYSEEVGFLFVTDFSIADLFRLRAAFVDPKLYGLRITVDVSEKSPAAVLNGLELELLYRKISENVGMFSCTLIVPKKFSTIQLGAVTVHIGRLYVEIYTNGSFFIDLGFPHNEDFSRSFGIEFGIFTGRGGIYFGVLKGDAGRSVPETDKGTFTPVVLIGLGVSIGLGRSFDAGIVKGSVSLTLLAMLEGVFAVYRPKQIADSEGQEEFYYRVSARAGVCGTLFLSVDFKIISVSASARVQAVCALTLESYRDTEVSLALSLEVSASVKILFIRIYFSFSFHRTVSFKLASGGKAPWDTVPVQNAEGRLAQRVRLRPAALENKAIYVNITPVISMYHPLEETKRYCIAFLATVDEDGFEQLVDLFFQWALSDEEGDGFCSRDYVLALAASSADDITWETVERLFAQNLTVHVSLTGADTQDGEETSSVSFPMLPYLTMKLNETTIDFGQNPVDEAYFKKLSDYLALLNADPCQEEGDREALDTNDSLPACAAVALDYCKMLLSGITDRLKELYEEISVSGIGMSDVMEAYRPDAEEFLSANPDLGIRKAVISNHLHVLSETDSLESLEDLDQESVWDNLSEKNGILRLGAELAIDFTFENRGELSPKQAAAMLYSRYCSRDIIYLKQVDQVKACGVTSQWECETPCSRTLDLGFDKLYTALAGDTLIRIARMLAVLEEDYQDEEWETFYRNFLEDNHLTESDTSPLRAYRVRCGTVLKDDRTPAKLFRRVYPDFAGKPEERGLWKSALFEPLQEIYLGSVEESSEKTIRQLMELYGAGELADSLTAGRLEEREGQTLHIPKPKRIPSDTLRERIGAAAREIGGMLSRFFLQGLRVPSDSGDGLLPLYELLKQQNPLEEGRELSVSLSGSPECAWVVVDTDRQTFSAEQMEGMKPSGHLPERALPQMLPMCEEQESCTTLFDFRIVDGGMTAAGLSEAFRKELQEVAEGGRLQLFADGNETKDFRWGVVMDFTVQRAGTDSYLVFGVAAGERKRLLSMAERGADSLKIAFAPSKLSSDRSRLVSVPTDSCVLVKTNLSVQTHMGVYGMSASYSEEEAFTYSAKITQTKRFLNLLWECSVIGGGFFLHCREIPENIFSEDGRGTLCICAAYSEFALARPVTDSILIAGKYKELMFKNDAKHVYTPMSPAGCVRLLTRAAENGTIEELFQIMSYTARMDGQSVESAPIFPQNGENEKANEYLFTVPLYRLVDQDNRYSAVGKTLSLEIGLRDILGNYAKLGDTEATGEYNDELISVCEYPRTKVSYELFDDKSGTPLLRIRLEYAASQGTKVTKQEQSRARTAMQQLNCADVSVRITCTAQKDIEWKLTGTNGLSKLRAYLAELTRVLLGEGGEVKAVEFVFTLDMEKLPGDIFALGAACEIVRDGCESACERVCRAAAAIPADESMEDSVRFGGVLLASCGTGLYGVKESFLRKLDVKAYLYEQKSTPRFYAMAPFANRLISRKIISQGLDGTETERIYSGCDLNAWVRRFFEDVEYLLDGENVCMAGAICPDCLDELVEGKKLLAEKTSSRVVSLCRELTGTDEENKKAQEIFRDYYLARLTNVYALDVAAAYQADFPVGSSYRLEIGLKESSLFLPQKIAGQEQENSEEGRQFFLLSCNAEHKTTEKALHFFVQDIEYHIEPGIGQYDSSDWVRLREAYTPARPELQADFGIPHPIALCPSAPSVLGQEAAAAEKIARWDYTVTLSCLAYEQYTLYLKIRIGEETAVFAAEKGRDMFEVLADYDEERERILRSLKDHDFSFAYREMAQTAKALASAFVPEKLPRDSAEREINLKLTFQKGETLVVQAEEIGNVLDRLGARLGKVSLLSGGEIGETAKFAVSIENLPFDSCQAVRPYAQIVQNENLFRDDSLRVRDEFIFRTEEAAGQPFYASVIYPDAFLLKSKDLSSAIHEIWASLGLDKPDVQMQADLEVSYLYQMTGLVDDLEMSCPVTFLPQASDETKAADDIKSWFNDKSFVLSDGRLCLRVWLRAMGDGRILGQLAIRVEWEK